METIAGFRLQLQRRSKVKCGIQIKILFALQSPTPRDLINFLAARSPAPNTGCLAYGTILVAVGSVLLGLFAKKAGTQAHHSRSFPCGCLKGLTLTLALQA